MKLIALKLILILVSISFALKLVTDNIDDTDLRDEYTHIFDILKVVSIVFLTCLIRL